MPLIRTATVLRWVEARGLAVPRFGAARMLAVRGLRRFLGSAKVSTTVYRVIGQ